MTFPVFLDTSAIYGGLLNDVLLRLAEADTFRPLWSEHVLGELEASLARRITPEAAERRVGRMRAAFPDANVTGYEALIDRMTCDEKDRHVLAAAVRADAAVIVTFNLSDFARMSLAPFDLLAVHPDEFLLDQLDLYPDRVLRVIEDLAADYEHPPMTVEQLVARVTIWAPKFARAVRNQI